MKISKALSPLEDLRTAVYHAFFPTLKAVWQNPFLLFRPVHLSRVFMNHVWLPFGNGIDENSRSEKIKVIQHARGSVLDIGAGHGHAVAYLSKDRVTNYTALEPNELMHSEIRARANAAGFSESDGSLTILSCGAQEISAILDAIQPVDTIISILTICSIPEPQASLAAMVKQVLKPGGQLLFYEHVQNPLPDVAWWQSVWTPIWSLGFDGCKMDRPTHRWVAEICHVDEHGKEMSIWSEEETWDKEGEERESLFWHQSGRFVKVE
jgi:SAM-dependent methyltransferase